MMSEQNYYYKIKRSRAEIPFYVGLTVLFLIGGMIFFFNWMVGLFLAIAPTLFYVFCRITKQPFLSGDFYVIADEKGVAWRKHIFAKMIFLPWNSILEIDVLLFEINFKLVESKQIICFETSTLPDKEVKKFKDSLLFFFNQK